MSVIAIALEKTHIKIAGHAAAKFLQGQLTCDVNEISQDHSSLSAHCNPQGRMISLGRLYLYQEQMHYALPTSIANVAIAHLKHYGLFSKLNFTEASLKSIGLAGENLRGLLENQFSLPKELNQCSQHGELLIIQVQSKPDRFEIIGPAAKLNELINSLGIQLSNDNSLWQCLEIEAGQAFLCQQTIGKFLPHDIRLPELNAVSFTKGCYIGQEIIARMHYLGKLKKQLWLVETQAEMDFSAQKLLDQNQKAQAELICQAKTQSGQRIALAVFNQAPEQESYSLENGQKISLRKLFN
ncbi:MAG: folate-binding protein [Gammaproteobacteria bacterium]|jgi:folate-binding protein YgfZ|nr:folate-binding protein [Gammaproteobacteria bacterium]